MKKRLAIGALLLLALLGQAYEQGEILFRTDFNTAEALGSTSRAFRPHQGRDGGGAFQVNGSNSSNWISIPLPPQVRGAVIFEAVIKGEDISVPDKPYYGAKVMLEIELEDGRKLYIEPVDMQRSGSFDWTACARTYYIPETTASVFFRIGLQNVTGTLWMDQATVYRAIKSDGGDSEAVKPDITGIPPGGGRGARYRGFMSGRDMSPGAFQKLAEWNVNLIRYQINAGGDADLSSPAKYLAWIESELPRLDAAIAHCRQYGMKLCIDLHTGPYGSRRNAVSSNLIHDPEIIIGQLEAVWTLLAERYRGNEVIYGYDILNEPLCENILPGAESAWETIAKRVVAAIRRVDPDTPVVIEPDLSDVRKLFHLDDPAVIYSIHTYEPIPYTHQFIGSHQLSWSYPGVINGHLWNKDRMRQDLREVIAFQNRYDVPIFVGEFSVALWAPGADQYLRDLIELFEEYGWDWTYHAFRESSLWSLEHAATQPGGKIQSSAANPRQDTLRRFLQRNQRQTP